MKFLIDECLHTSLVTVAHDAGHVCDHVNFLGLGGHKDWQLMVRTPIPAGDPGVTCLVMSTGELLPQRCPARFLRNSAAPVVTAWRY